MVKLRVPSWSEISDPTGRLRSGLRKFGRVSAWTFGIFSLALLFLWTNLPTTAIAWRISHEARKAGYLLDVEDVSVGMLGSVTLENVTWNFAPSRAEEDAVPFFVEELDTDFDVLEYLILGELDVELEAELDEGSLYARYEKDDDETRVEVDINSVPMTSLPKLQQTLNAPLEGNFELHAKLAVPEHKFAKAKGQISFACTQCAMGDGETKLYVPRTERMSSAGLTVPKIQLGELAGTFEVVDGRATAEEVVSVSDDISVKLGGQIRLSDPFSKGRLELSLKVFISEAIQAKDDNFRLFVAGTSEDARMDPPDEGWLGFRIRGPITRPQFVGIKTKTKEENLREARAARRERRAEAQAKKNKRKADAAKKKPSPKPTAKGDAAAVKVKVDPTAKAIAEPAMATKPATKPDVQPDEGGDGGGDEAEVEEVEEVEDAEEEVVEEEDEEQEGDEEEDEESEADGADGADGGGEEEEEGDED
jgi:type II secretion system protein N